MSDGPLGTQNPVFMLRMHASEHDNEVLFRENNEHDDARNERGIHLLRTLKKKKESIRCIHITTFRDAIWHRCVPGKNHELFRERLGTISRETPTNRPELEMYPRQPSFDNVRKVATRVRMKRSPVAFPPSPHDAIYRPYLWHSGTLTVPAIPLYTPL